MNKLPTTAAEMYEMGIAPKLSAPISQQILKDVTRWKLADDADVALWREEREMFGTRIKRGRDE
jgi:hypothetical protein